MLNFGWAEMLVIGVVALIVIGPEDLPDMFRQMGRFTAKLRNMSREFSRAMEQAAKETGVKDVAKDLRAVTSPKAMGLDAVKSAADKFEKWDPIKNAAKPTSTPKPLVPPPMPATPVVTDDLAEAADDLADHAEPAKPHGPATQALYDKKAAREAVLREQAAKLRAIEDGSYEPPGAEAPVILPPKTAKPAWKVPPRTTKAAAEPAAEPAAETSAPPAKPRAPRKSSKKADVT
jgi:sec-independent protein translocase protein TatB